MRRHRWVLVLGLLHESTGLASAQALPDSVMVAHFVDVGQGSAALLEFSCGVVMIDVGGQSAADVDRLVAYLGNFFRARAHLDSTISSIVLTHNHVDHTRALRRIIEVFAVRHVVEHGRRGRPGDIGDASLVWLAAGIAAGQRRVALIDVNDQDIVSDAGLVTNEIDPLQCPGVDPAITILSADLNQNPGWTVSDFRDKNNHSLVVRVDFGESSFLFTGDLEVPAIETLLDYYAGSPMLDADVYQVGHHGSANGTTWELLDAIREPEIAILSVGPCARNEGTFNAFRFGHPRATVVDMLRAAVRRRRSTPKRVPVADGVENFHLLTMRDAVYATGWDGTVTVRATAGGRYQVNLERQDVPGSC
jgi:competence protein ComEC